MLNDRIPLQYRGMQLESPVNALSQVLQVQGQQQGNALQRMKMEDFQQQQAERMAAAQKAAQQQAQQNALLQGLRPVSGIDANRVSGIAGPRPEALSVVGQRPKVDAAAMLAAGFDPKTIEFMANAGTLGMPEVARTVSAAGPDGRPVTQQRDKFGRLVGDAIPEAVKLQLENMGGQSVAVDPYGLRPGQTLQRTQTPDSIASNQVQRRGQNMADARARDKLTQDAGTATAELGGPGQALMTKQFGKAAPGYRWKADGSQEAIPGGPADRKNTDAGIREQRQREGAVKQAGRVIAKVDEALGMVGYNSAGVGGAVLGVVPGTEARDLEATLETVKANLGFAELQAMRDASPTGGALGAIAVQELIALQSTVASLDRKQSPPQLRKSLGDVRKHYGAWKDAVNKAAAGEQPGGKTVTRTGTQNGRKVVQYSDGSVEYAD